MKRDIVINTFAEAGIIISNSIALKANKISSDF